MMMQKNILLLKLELLKGRYCQWE